MGVNSTKSGEDEETFEQTGFAGESLLADGSQEKSDDSTSLTDSLEAVSLFNI